MVRVFCVNVVLDSTLYIIGASISSSLIKNISFGGWHRPAKKPGSLLFITTAVRTSHSTLSTDYRFRTGQRKDWNKISKCEVRNDTPEQRED
jgi:hypothetical protein